MTAAIYFDRLGEADSEFQRRLERSMDALHRMDIGPGKVVALMLHNEPIVLELMLATRAVGAHCCPINWHFKAKRGRPYPEDSGASVLIVHSDLIEQIVDGIPASVRVLVADPRARTREAFALQGRVPALDVGHEAWAAVRDAVEGPFGAPMPPRPPGSIMAYTSGTTGLPKGVRRSAPTPDQVQRLAEATRVVLGIGADMRALVSAPLYHSAPANYVIQAALKDAHIWIEPRFDAEATLKLIDAERITHAYLVPTMFNRLLHLDAAIRDKYRVDSLRFVACTGAPFAAGTKARMIDWWGPVIHECYAASELGWITHIDSHEALRKPGSVGRAIPGTVIKIFSDAGVALAGREAGLIHARSSAVPDFTYANNSEARRQLEREGLWTLSRRRLPRRGGLSLYRRSTERHGHLGRGQHLSRGDRGDPCHAARRCGLRGIRNPRRRIRRVTRRRHPACWGRRAPGGRGAGVPAASPGQLQGSPFGDIRMRTCHARRPARSSSDDSRSST